MMILETFHDILASLRRIIFPDKCIVCGTRLTENEEAICQKCLTLLPYTRFSGNNENPLGRLFYGKIHLFKADALLFYHAGSNTSHILYHLKYHHRPDIGYYFGQIMADNLLPTDFFHGIDAIIPIPLSKKRIRKRGYNQSEKIAQGVSEKTGIPIWTDYVKRIKDNPTQTRIPFSQRQANVQGIFYCPHPQKGRGKHLLLIDDVVTSGSTILECMAAIGEGVRFSILVLCMASAISDLPGSVAPNFDV